MQPQQFMKNYFPSDSLEPMSCHLSTRPRVTHQTSPNQTPIDKRRISTIFNHFRDKPARYRLNEYYNSENKVLEHFRFKQIFLRRSKKAFISFVPMNLVERISQKRPLTSPVAVQNLVRKKGLKVRFADIRETHATFMTKYLKDNEIDFLHGRVASNVFMRNYFNPSMIGDLKERAIPAIEETKRKSKKD